MLEVGQLGQHPEELVPGVVTEANDAVHEAKLLQAGDAAHSGGQLGRAVLVEVVEAQVRQRRAALPACHQKLSAPVHIPRYNNGHVL